MLPVHSRVSSREEHARIGREGRRITCSPLIVHVLSTPDTGPARAGFVVSRKVGPAVTRNRVRRRLREQTRSRLPSVPPGTLLVIRALPPAAKASSAELGGALDRGFAAMRTARSRPSQDRSARGRATPARADSAAGRASRRAGGQSNRGAERPASAGPPDETAAPRRSSR